MPIGEVLFRDGELSSANDQLKLGANDVTFVIIPAERVGSLFFLWVQHNSRLCGLSLIM
jgi:hypothetical protein